VPWSTRQETGMETIRSILWQQLGTAIDTLGQAIDA
jgi:hypothetical protein